MDQTLFNLIKSHQYDKLINIIKIDDKIDLNIIDESGTYLLQYIILFRQKDLLALVISRNCKLDILDSDGRSIFFVPIKFGYNDIVKLLINFSNIVIGIPLLELQDNKKNIPLHYAIMFNKYDIIEEILDTNSNINFKDIDGNTALHLIVKNLKIEKIELLTILINKKISINHINNLGQNALHIAVENNNIDIVKILLKYDININTQTTDDHLTPLIISTINNNVEICELLLKYSPNLNSQDIYGNSILSHSIMNKSKQLIKLYYENIDVNLVNISGQISINLFFDNNYDLNKLDEYYFSDILKKSNINVQNNQGKTTWHYLILNDYWEKYYDILITKKNKIFIQDLEGLAPYEIIETKYKNKFTKFIELIAYSFYNQYIQKPSNQFEFIFTNINNKEKTIEQIKKIIIEKHISVPKEKKTYCINEETYENIKFSSYVGISLDIICGLIYIKQKFKNIDSTLTENFITNETLEDYYKSNGIQKVKYSEFLNFEIIWSFHKLFIPTILKEVINKFLLDKTKEYLIIPLGIELSNGAHANILLYNKLKNELERFEPYGKDYPPGFNYNPKSLDLALKNLFFNFFDSEIINHKEKFKYFSPVIYQKKIGPQFLDSYEYSKEKNIGDPGGFCAAWSLWYIEMRINNKNISKDYLLDKLINHIRMKQIPFRTIIRNYTKNIMDIRDKILLSADIDINKWLNENFTEEQWNKIIEEIKKYINIL